MMNDYNLSVILPVYNEEANIHGVIEQVRHFLICNPMLSNYEIIVVNDGSSDYTSRVLCELSNNIPFLRIITHAQNSGYGRALISGVNTARYSLLLFLDADGQFQIDEAGTMLKHINICDIIVGYRYKRIDKFHRIILGKFITLLVCFLFGLEIKDINCGFKLFRREVLVGNRYKCRGAIFYSEVLLTAKRNGLRIKEIPVRHFPRLKGKEKGATFTVLLQGTIDLLKLLKMTYWPSIEDAGTVKSW